MEKMAVELTTPQREALKEIWRRTPEPGDWARCPHGFPIPGEGEEGVPQLSQLYDLEKGETVVVALSSSVSQAMVAFLAEMGLVPGAKVEVISKQPFGGPLMVRVEGVERTLGERAGRQVRVRMLAPGPQGLPGAVLAHVGGDQ
jgi:DtxR family Mn-dependent transcriptional regulator